VSVDNLREASAKDSLSTGDFFERAELTEGGRGPPATNEDEGSPPSIAVELTEGGGTSPTIAVPRVGRVLDFFALGL
jgi:hypothetical protein